MIVHNVHHRMIGRIGSYETEPLVYDDLSTEDVGRTVIYQTAGAEPEAGSLTSWRDGIVFARYSTGDTAAGADPKNLCFAIGRMLG